MIHGILQLQHLYSSEFCSDQSGHPAATINAAT